MRLSLGEWLGLTAGIPDPSSSVAAMRYGLVVLAGLWALSVLLGRRRWAVLGGLILFEAAVGYWVLALSRPYGVFADPSITRRAAEVSLAAEGGLGTPIQVGRPEEPTTTWSRLAAGGVPPAALLLAPTLLPLLVVPLMSGLVLAFLRPRRDAWPAALLWLAFSTSDFDALRGVGVVPEPWRRPESAVLLVALGGLPVLETGPGARGARRMALATALLAAGACLAPGDAARPALGDVLAALLVEPLPLLPFAGLGLARDRFGAASRLVAAGAGLSLAGCVLPAGDPFLTQGLYRFGLVLAAVRPLLDALSRLVEALPLPARLARAAPEQVGLGLLLLLLVPTGFLVWWDPPRMDRVAGASLRPLDRDLREAMDWIRENTPGRATFVTRPAITLGSAVAVLGGRSVLRAPDLLPEPDRERRAFERGLLTQVPWRGDPRFPVTHLLVGPRHADDTVLEAARGLDALPHLRRVFAHPAGYAVLEIVSRDAPAGVPE
jgi:hypothetical protein